MGDVAHVPTHAVFVPLWAKQVVPAVNAATTTNTLDQRFSIVFTCLLNSIDFQRNRSLARRAHKEVCAPRLTRRSLLWETVPMGYSGKIEYAEQRKIRERNTTIYRMCHLPIWIWVYFLVPGPLTFSLFERGFSTGNTIWLLLVLIGVAIAGYYAQLPGVEHRPYILRFDEDKPNPLYRRVCYTFAWNAVLNFALLNLAGLVFAVITGVWRLKQIYDFFYFPLMVVILFFGIAGKLPRVGPSTKREGIERRYFYGSVWAVTIAQTVLLILWKALPETRTGSLIKLAVFVGVLAIVGVAASRGLLPRTRPILPGETMVSD